ncbi:MAG: NYN domain-containing protein [Prevotella sp.]|nr:NYN domain-containing protein [Bacteroides sp.]MCM1366770.1 NYN domain-containing protein [Prevotella sp.]MCM1437389.1 NYN domain-containing protein [Prevotella sp.]
MTSFLSIGVFIDGGYYAKINRALKATESSIIRVRSLFDFISARIGAAEGVNISDCQITEAHYFRGRFRVKDAYDKHLLYNERKFEDTLIENDVIFHYKHLREIERDGAVQVIEKGVDVWFALEAYELATFRKFDYVVLITGDADHEMLVRKLKALKIKTVLLTWNLANVDATSPLLKEEAGYHWEISSLIQRDPQLKRSLLYRLREPAVEPLGDIF